MGFFDRFRKKTDGKPAAKKDEPVSKELEAVKQARSAEETPLKKAEGGSTLSVAMLRRPHVSEKAASLTSQGTYVFDVPVEAEKIAIKKAVESLYKVKVVGVRTIRHAGKPVYRGRHPGRRNEWKKALVTLAKDQKIDLYEGV